jgi:hypothetical protein
MNKIAEALKREIEAAERRFKAQEAVRKMTEQAKAAHEASKLRLPKGKS